MRYAVILTDEDGDVVARFPDVPEALTFGENPEDALSRALDAIETALMGAMTAREDIPAPKAEGRHYVTLPALSAAKIELYRAMRSAEVGKAALAKKLDVALPQIDRLLDLRHASRLDALERALAALGKTLRVEVTDAA
jgi:antitoxin HicB